MSEQETGRRSERGGGDEAGAWTRAAVRAVLARHGVAPEANEVALRAALAARGWEVRVEDVPGPEGAPVVRAVAQRRLRGRGRTTEAALGRVLAQVLEQEGEAPERGR